MTSPQVSEAEVEAAAQVMDSQLPDEPSIDIIRHVARAALLAAKGVAADCSSHALYEYVASSASAGCATAATLIASLSPVVKPEQEVEAAAKAIYADEYKFPEWEDATIRESTRNNYRNRARAALTAAAQVRLTPQQEIVEGYQEALAEGLRRAVRGFAQDE